MPTLREIKGHINSVRSIAKTTRAMEVVSAVKYRRLQARAERARPFAEKSWEVLNHLASAAEGLVRGNAMFCGYGEVKRLGILLLTSDRGMVGAYDHNVTALALDTARASGAAVEFVTIGKMGREAILRQGHTIHADFPLSDTVNLMDLTPVARLLLDGFRDRVWEQIVIAHTQMRSGAHLQPIVRQLLPVCPSQHEISREYIYEPDAQELLLALLPRLVRFQIYQALLESRVAESLARRMAMHAATRNASDLIHSLTIHYNKARQQQITAEIIDILGATTVRQERAS